MTTTPRPDGCGCKVCNYLSARTFFAWKRAIFAHVSAANDPEAAVRLLAERWHEYAPLQEAVVAAMPQYATETAWYRALDTDPLIKLRSWHDDQDEDQCMAVLAGPPGTGKTVAAVWLAIHRLADQGAVSFVTGPELARLPRSGPEREELLAADVTIIDDLGMEIVDAKFRVDFDEIVDGAYRRGTYLLITTNASAEEFRRRYGERVVDRFAERGTWLPAPGPSLRRST